MDSSPVTGSISPNEGPLSAMSSGGTAACGRAGEEKGRQEEQEEEEEEEEEGAARVSDAVENQRIETRGGVKRVAGITPSILAPEVNRLSPSLLDEICARQMDQELLKTTIDGNDYVQMSQESRHLAFLSSASFPEMASHVQVFLEIIYCLYFVLR